MLSKIKTLCWYVRNPQYLGHLRQLVVQRINRRLEATRDESTKWCERVALQPDVAFTRLVGPHEVEDVVTKFTEIFQQANRKAAACPVRMGGEGAVSFLYSIARHSEASQILETGVAYGWSSLAFLLALRDKGGGRLISNDMPYAKMDNEDSVGCVVPENLQVYWELQRLPDFKGIPLALKKFPDGIDIVHYDSDKSYTGRKWSMPQLWAAIRPDGFFISDDINDNLAFKDFCDAHNLEPIVFKHLGKYVGVIRKPRN